MKIKYLQKAYPNLPDYSTPIQNNTLKKVSGTKILWETKVRLGAKFYRKLKSSGEQKSSEEQKSGKQKFRHQKSTREQKSGKT